MQARKTCRLSMMISNSDGIQISREIIIRWKISKMHTTAVAQLEQRNIVKKKTIFSFGLFCFLDLLHTY